MPLSRVTSANTIGLFGSTSGKTTLQANTVAGTTTLTLPAATDTLVGRATTDTLTNKTLTTPVISSLSSASATALTLQSAGTTAITVDTSQNVGIGTTSPSSKLEISDASSNSLRIKGAGDHALGFTGYSSNAATQVFSIRNDGINNCYINTQNSVPLSFGVSTGTSFGSTTEHMRINSSGNVGIGVTPTVRFQVSGSSIFSDTVQVFNYPTSGGSGQQGILFRNTYNAGGSIFSMGSATTNDLILWYGGSGTHGAITGNGAGVNYSSNSDYRLKENIAPMTGALAKVAQLKPCTYNWKFDGSEGQGFIAHELQEFFPDAVTGTKDQVETYTDEDGNEQTKIKPQGIDTSFVVATLAAAIQEQQALITALTARVDTQAADIAELKTKVA